MLPLYTPFGSWEALLSFGLGANFELCSAEQRNIHEKGIHRGEMEKGSK
jgi:hypothetical protein